MSGCLDNLLEIVDRYLCIQKGMKDLKPGFQTDQVLEGDNSFAQWIDQEISLKNLLRKGQAPQVLRELPNLVVSLTLNSFLI
ncbi:hypothetical protein AQUCO_01200032v1 [Aquilegia coerulea]|uniref:Uncharacterized protein n=1 Tax=Aquilegia coerulea TaxID=218851 RepID=A0A2G5E4S7_AQUCA|nr:hypothetical protein AQUCO_01200032v1 [Aquilegia coerulea]